MSKILFTSSDHTFCVLKSCSKKENCVRYLEHYSERIKLNPRISILMLENEKDCNLFISNNEMEE